jgi:hypothetical protein
MVLIRPFLSDDRLNEHAKLCFVAALLRLDEIDQQVRASHDCPHAP